MFLQLETQIYVCFLCIKLVRTMTLSDIQMSADGSFCRPEGTLSLMLEPSEIFHQFFFDIIVHVVIVVDIVVDVGTK